MSLEQLTKRQESLVAEMTKSLKARGFDPAALDRPDEIRSARADAIKARIEAIEASKKVFVAQADTQIEALKTELAALEQGATRDRGILQPVIDATGGSRSSRPSGPSAKATGKPRQTRTKKK